MRFPEFLHNNPHPGYRYQDDEVLKALFNTSFKWPKSDEGFFNSIVQWGITQPNAINAFGQLDIGTLSRRNIVSLDGSPQDGADPFDADLYAMTLKWIEGKGYLDTPVKDQTLASLRKLLKMVALNCCHPCHRVARGLSKGAYRNGDITVVNNDHFLTPLPEHVTPFLQDNDPEMLPNYEAFYNRMQATKVSLAKTSFSPAAQAFIDKYLYIAPAASDVPARMNAFLTELLERLGSDDADTNAIENAAWAHMQLVKIHAWGDINGRTARTLMWIILMQAGHHPFEMQSNKAYTEAVNGDDGSGYVFAQYLQHRLPVIEEEAHAVDER